MVKRKFPFAFMAKMTNLPSKASQIYQCPIACPTFQNLLSINSSSKFKFMTQKKLHKYMLSLYFLENQVIHVTLRNIANFEICENHGKFLCLTCFITNM